jgi:hypothetical protein
VSNSCGLCTRHSQRGQGTCSRCFRALRLFFCIAVNAMFIIVHLLAGCAGPSSHSESDSAFIIESSGSDPRPLNSSPWLPSRHSSPPAAAPMLPTPDAAGGFEEGAPTAGDDRVYEFGWNEAEEELAMSLDGRGMRRLSALGQNTTTRAADMDHRATRVFNVIESRTNDSPTAILLSVFLSQSLSLAVARLRGALSRPATSRVDAAQGNTEADGTGRDCPPDKECVDVWASPALGPSIHGDAQAHAASPASRCDGLSF